MCYTAIVSDGGGDGSTYKGNKERSMEEELTQLRKIIPARGSILASCSRRTMFSSESATCFRPATRRLIKASLAHSLLFPFLHRFVLTFIWECLFKITESTTTDSCDDEAP